MSSSVRAFPSRRTSLGGAALLLLLFALVVLAIGPVHEFPVEDDWDYARMARLFAETGQLQRSDYAQATLVFPAVYGGLVARLFGFSFTALRLSTLLLALVTLLAFYALLGELEFSPPLRLLGAAALLLTPIFIYLAFSFMTDVPALCWLVLAALFYVRALKRASPLDAFLGSLCAAAMFLTRQTGIFVPVAFGLVALVRLTGRARLMLLTVGCAPALAVIALYFLLNREGSANWATQNITFGLTLQQMLQPEWWGIFVRRAVQTLMTLGVYLSPLLLALVFARRDRILPALYSLSRPRLALYALVALVFAVTVARLALRGEWFPYLTDILTRAGLRPYLAYYAYDAGALRPDLLSLWATALLTLFAAACGFALALLALAPLRLDSLRRAPVEHVFLWALVLLIAVASLVFATFYERYLLPLLAGALVLVLARARRAGVRWSATFRGGSAATGKCCTPFTSVPVSRRAYEVDKPALQLSIPVALAGLGVLAAASWLLMTDYWSWNEARWQLGRSLLAQNIPARRIDGGYEWDGWYLYDATVEYIRATGKPFIYDPWQYVLDPEYVLAFLPMRGYRIERTVEFDTPFPSDRFYLLRRE